ncbi:type I polyketide synthase, partial [Catenulispora subtropica]|uniref:type I polyketide synthase n=1 Tax=Catenulispora subtropica TaxID=450798 RepID=UPI0031D94CA4
PATADFAAHSPRVEPIEPALTRALAGLHPAEGRIAFYSTAHGRWMSGPELGPGYWYANVREQVRFADAVAELARSGHRTFLEVSAQPTLTGAITETVQEADLPAPVVSGTVTREDAGAAGLLASFAGVHVQGVALDWPAILGGRGTRVDLPTYAFQHRRFWLKPLEATVGGNPADDELWSAVEDGDVGRLADALALDAERAGDLLPALASWRRRERADSRYRITWSAVADPGSAVLSGTWLAVLPPGGDAAAEPWIRALTERGAQILVLDTDAADLDREHLAGRLTEAVGETALSGIVSFPAGLDATLTLVQALGDATVSAPLWVVTRGAVSAVAGDPVADPFQARIWGLGRVVGLEHPERWGGLVDLPAAWDDRAASGFCAVLAGLGEDQVAVRESGLLARRLARAPQTAAKRTWTPHGTVLVTGGTGALGRHVGRWLADRGAERIVLASRSGPAAFDVAALAAGLAAAGARVDIVSCDVTQEPATSALLARAAASGPPLTAVFHLAGVSQTTQVADTTLADLAAVTDAKTGGARLLDTLTADLALDAFVLFSSAAATWGGAQQPGFAAANAHLDALAEARRAAGRTATAIAWGPWAGDGIADGDAGEQMRRRGLTPLDPARAVAALGRALDADDLQVTIADVDWQKFAPTFTLRRPSPLIEALPEVRQALAAVAAQSSAENDGALAEQVKALTRSEQDRLLTDLVRAEAAAVLKYPSAAAVEPHRAFSELGFDSLTSVELRNRLGTATGLRLPATLLFDYPTAAVLAEYLRTGLLGIGADDEALRPKATAVFDRTGADDPIAIIGLGCRFPGGITTPEDLWELLATGGDAIGAFPTNRGWDIDSIYDPDPGHTGTSYVRHGGFLHEATDFDAGFFGISPREALAMDPQQRLLLEVSWEALERAGIDPHSLRGTATGVFAGASFAGYGLAPSDDSENLEAHLLTGTTTSVISGRVSYTLGLEGPAVTVDTACSSTLVALHLACQALRTGECSLALAGGAFVSASPELFVWTSRQRGLAQDGRCKSYAGAADGMGISEGAGMILVERLSDARANGHPVLAVVRGSAVNQDGASNGLTAPNGPSQQRVIRAALANARITTDDVDVVEGHGSGTTLGDPIEAQAVIATYGQGRPEGLPMYLGSVKSNIGHAQAAAGSAGVIKMVMALRNELLPQTLHIDEPSPHIDWSAGDVQLLTEAVPWPSGGERTRRAGVSSFGVSGTNAHIILEEAPLYISETEDEAETPGGDGDGDGEAAVLAPWCGVTAWPVSGRSTEGLTGQAGRLREFVLGHPELEPADVAWSLATSRSTFEHRAVVIGGDRGALAAGLAAVATGQAAPGVVTGSAGSAGGRTAFVFPGQGSQWAGMGRELLADSPVFAARLAECAEALSPLVGWSLPDVIENAEALDTADVAQPVMWAVMVSLAAMWQAAGVNPEAVIGHSQGEIAAATVAGILSLEDGARVVVTRAKALADLNASGGLMAVVMPEPAVLAVIEETGFADRITVAAVNSPAATVVSGVPADLDAFEAKLSKRRILRWRVPATADFVAHSPRVEPIEATLRAALSGIRPADGTISFYSTAHNRWMSGAELDAGYWYTNVREQVRFADAVVDLAQNGFRTFVEVSAQPTLTGAVTECADEAGVTGTVVTGTVTRDDAGAAGLLASLARAHVEGVPVDWRAVFGGGDRVPLPTYAFQRRRYWMQGSTAQAAADPAADAAEARFWAAVEDGDLRELAAELAIDGSRPLNDLLPALASWRRRERADSVVADWRYRVSWVQLPEPVSAALTGGWLLAVPEGRGEDPWVAGLIRALKEHGGHVVPVPVAVRDPALDRRALAAALTAAVAGLGDTKLSGVLSVLSLDETPFPDEPAVPSGVAGTLLLLQALGDAGIGAPLRILTTGAVATGLGEVVTSAVLSEIWGLGRVIALEHPDRWGGLIDLPASWDDRIAHRFCGLLTDVVEDQIAVRGSGILGRRLVRAPQAREARPWSPGGTVLITGGTGAIGGHVGRWLTGRGAERIVLTSRSGADAAGVPELAAALAGAGTDVVVASCDTSQRSHIAGVLDLIAAGGPPLSSVIHSAGVLDDGVLDRQNVPRLATTLGAKAAGAAWLDELTRDADLDAFVVFSSAAATFGGGGQGNYAAANAYLDGLVEKRRAAGLPGLSVAWGPWAGGGVSQATDAARARLRRNKWEVLMEPGLAVRALGQALDNPDDVTVTVIDIDWAQLCTAPAAAELRRHPMVRDLPDVVRNLAGGTGASRNTDSRGGAAEGELARRLSGLLPAEQERMLTDLVRAEAAAVLNYPSAEAVEPDRPFSELGFDSLTSVELRNQVSVATGLRLPATLLFDYPTPTVLAAYLRTEMLGALTGDGPGTDAPGVPAASGPALDPAEPLAIVGMGCRFPGGVRSPEDLWRLLETGAEGISPLPADRGWDVEALYDPDPDHAGTSYVREGGYVQRATEFDPAFFAISPREALAMDPQQRLLLETSWEALERAGIDPHSLRGSRTGVFVGGYGSGYEALGMAAVRDGAEGVEGHLVTGNATSILSGRVSYTLGLEGPAVTVDTACSSSLVAMHLAGQALRSGECGLALVSGVTIMATPRELIGFSRQRGLAADGRSKAFSAAADGMGMGEGVGTLIVERLSDARRNGHPVLAVVRGSAVNQDGASNGLTAPNGPSQQRVIRAALANAQLAPTDVDAVEAHGTGTPLGDPIEAQALMATYGQGRAEDKPLWLGSVKSNIGHAQAAAGVAGIMKVVLAMRHEVLPQTLHVEEPSPHIDWTEGDVRLLAAPVPWPAGGKVRRAGVSGFGISGTNAHVIVEEAPELEPVVEAQDEEKTPVLAGSDVSAWVLSGRGSEGLAGQAGRLREFVLAEPVEVEDVAYSLASSRARFDNRAVVVGRTREELTAGLAAVATKQSGPVVGVAKTGARVGFLFAGQGAQRAGMGRGLYSASPVFAESFDRVAAILEAELGLPVADVVLGRAKDVDADQTVFAQTGLFAVQVALVEMLTAAGVRPDAVAGHSVGEIAAAWAAGVLTLEDACRLVANRARLMQSLPEGGAMCAIAATEEEVLETLTEHVGIGAVNGPTATVVSGDAAEVEAVAEIWRGRERRVRPLRVSHAFHSHHMDPILEELGGVAGTLIHSEARVTWARAAVGEVGASYWTEQARQPVRFADAVNALAERGVTVFVEIGPDGTLSAIGSAAVPGDAGATFIPLLRSKSPAPVTVATALARAHVLGIDVDWPAVLGTADKIDLPTYAFQHQSFWPQVAQVYGGKPAEATGAEAEFWSAVEGGDVTQLADTLAVDGDRLADLLPALASWRRREREDSAVADWRYRVTWAPIPEPSAAVVEGTWLVIAPAGASDSELTAGVAQALAHRGAGVRTLAFGAADLDRAALTARLTETAAGLVDTSDTSAGAAGAADSAAGPLTGVISLLALDETPLPDLVGVPFGVGATLVLAQALGDAGIAAPLWAVTRGAVTTGRGESVTHPVQGQIWGLGRVIGLEHPERWGGLVDLPQEWDDQIAAKLCAVLATPTADTGEDQIAVRAAGLHGRRLAHAPQARTGREWTPRGSVLITGGTGAIGGHAGRWVAERGAEKVVLCSRSGPSAGTVAALAADLAAAGAAVDVVACDTGSRDAVQGLLTRIAATGPALSAVLHTAGVGQATYITDTTLAEQAAVCGAKTAGAAWLDELTRDAGLDAFIVFSSIAAVWGSAMQPGYAAGNAYLDAMMENRRAQGLPALSVSWGPWGGGGMTAVEDAERMVKRGLKLLDPRLAMQALAQAVDAGEDLLTVVDVDWATFAPLFTLRRPSPLIEALPEVAAALAAAGDDSAGEGAGGELAAQLAGLSAADQDRVLIDLVRAEAARALGYPSADAVEPDRAFSDLGFDSLTGVELRNRLTAATGRPISATVVFDYPTPIALAGHLRQAIAPAEPEQLPLLAELDRIESLLSTAAVAEGDSGKVTARLEAVMTKWKEIRGLTEGTAVMDKLESSSDDEIFDFLGKEFGIR